MTREYLTQMKPVAARARSRRHKSAVETRGHERNRTKVLRGTKFLCRTREVLDSCGDKTPFHEWGPEKDGLGTLKWVSVRGNERRRRGESPAGWFTNLENFVAPAEAAAPDIFCVVFEGKAWKGHMRLNLEQTLTLPTPGFE